MARSAVPLNALRAFEAAARHLSFTRAADELCVTQAAISHQVKGLEDRLGVALFRRSNRGLMLTDEGSRWRRPCSRRSAPSTACSSNSRPAACGRC